MSIEKAKSGDTKTMISIIIPVYNVAPYIDRCMESIVSQSYQNLEILLINDGSTDTSLERCLAWRKKDDRVIVIDKKNDGLGPVRNYGIHIARGEYIASVDPDDWVDSQYIEKLLSAIIRYNADLVVCNSFEYIEQTGQKIVGYAASGNSLIQTKQEKLDYMKKLPKLSFWGKLYRKSLLTDNQIYQPNTTAQDVAVVVQTIACANKIVTIEDVLYFYWVDRTASIGNSFDKTRDFVKVIQHSVSEMKRLELFEEYKEGQLAVLLSHCSLLLKRCEKDKDFSEKQEKYNKLFEQFFEGWKKQLGMNWFVWGSFNVRWTAQTCSQSYTCTPVHYSFASIISQFMGEKGKCLKILHTNKLRECAVQADIKGICESIHIQDEIGILIDFMEERYDILETEDGVLISVSEAFGECEKDDLNIKRVIKSGSVEFMALWQEACLKFITWLRNTKREVPIYLLKMRMAKGYGFSKVNERFEDQEKINATNQMLESMDTFFINNCKNVIYIQGEESLYFSQTAQRYGCGPHHLNWYLYRDMCKKIERYRDFEG